MTLFIRKTGDEKFKVQEFILGLSEKKGVWTTMELIDECRQQNFKEATIKRAISNLVQSGKLIKIRHGEYEINE